MTSPSRSQAKLRASPSGSLAEEFRLIDWPAGTVYGPPTLTAGRWSSVRRSTVARLPLLLLTPPIANALWRSTSAAPKLQRAVGIGARVVQRSVVGSYSSTTSRQVLIP